MTTQTSHLSESVAKAVQAATAGLFATQEDQERKPPMPWAEELERGGFTREGAPEDFDRVCRLAEALETGIERNAILLGGVGRGKTLAGTIIARRVFRPIGYERQFKPHYLRATQFSAMSRGGYEDAELVAMFRTATLCDVFLDDFGTDESGRIYSVETDICAEFLKNYCDKNDPRKHCIVTTNLPDHAAVRQRVGDRIFDRMLASFAWIQFRSKNKRVEKARGY